MIDADQDKAPEKLPGAQKQSDDLDTESYASEKLAYSHPVTTTTCQEATVSQNRSASRDSVNDDPRSLAADSLSATSSRPIWSSNKDIADDDPSISSIKGDSVSATIADYNRKHSIQATGQIRARLTTTESSNKSDNLSVNVNFYASGSFTGANCTNANPNNSGPAKQADLASTSSNAYNEAFDIIEETSNSSPREILNHVNNCYSTEVRTAERQQRDIARSTKKKGNQDTRIHVSAMIPADDLPSPELAQQSEPIIIRGNGNLTLFGLSNSFNSEFPTALIGRVSREEFDYTMKRINSLLRDQQSLSAKLLLFGGLFCCCSLGFSLVWPSIASRKRSKSTLEKFLAYENSRLYSKLGLNLKLAEQRCYSNHAFVEYVLMIEFAPKINLHLPD